jgi:hypothetical protein
VKQTEAARVAHDVSVAASQFLLNQLPEPYTASERNESNFPVQYTGANVPQAWAAGSVFMLTQALLGFLPDAPRNKLYVDPSLPAWLPDLTMRDLRIGKHKLDIRFWRDGEPTAFEVIKGDSMLVERSDLALYRYLTTAGAAGGGMAFCSRRPLKRRRHDRAFRRVTAGVYDLGLPS